jgi:hypothetical protein
MPNLTASEIGFDLALNIIDENQNEISVAEFQTYFMFTVS